jgi:hypothetical protein
MSEVAFIVVHEFVVARVDGLEIASYQELPNGRFRVLIDSHEPAQKYRRCAVADSEARAQHWIRRWWARDEAIIRAGFAARSRERAWVLGPDADPAEIWRQPPRATFANAPRR